MQNEPIKEAEMAENKTKPTSASVDDFIANIENPRRRTDALTALMKFDNQNR